MRARWVALFLILPAPALACANEIAEGGRELSDLISLAVVLAGGVMLALGLGIVVLGGLGAALWFLARPAV